MKRARVQVEAAIEALIGVNLHLREQLEQNEQLLRDTLEHLRGGASIADAMTAIPSTADRQVAEDAVRDFYARRSEVRIAVIAAALAEGMSIPEVAEAFCIPHDQVALAAATNARLVDL